MESVKEVSTDDRSDQFLRVDNVFGQESIIEHAAHVQQADLMR